MAPPTTTTPTKMPSETITAPPKTSLMDLPTELHLEIYNAYLSLLELNDPDAALAPNTRDMTLLHLSHQTRAEALPLLTRHIASMHTHAAALLAVADHTIQIGANPDPYPFGECSSPYPTPL